MGVAPPTLRADLLRRLWLATALPLLLLGVLVATFEFLDYQRQESAGLRRRALLVREGFEARLDASLRAVEVVADDLAPLGARAAGETRRLESLLRLSPEFLSMILVGPEGRVVAAAVQPELGRPASEALGLDVSDRSYFRETLRAGRPFVSEAFQGRGLRRDLIVAVAAPVVGDDGWRGVVEGSIPLAALWRDDPLAEPPAGAELVLLDREGKVVVARGEADRRPLDRLAGFAEITARAGGEPFRRGEAGGPFGGYLAVSAASESTGYTVLSEIAVAALYRNASRTLALTLVLFAVALTVQVPLARALARRTAEPIADLVATMDRASGADDPVQVEPPASAPAELHDLALAFDRMAHRWRASDLGRRELVATLEQRVEERTRALAKSEEELRRAHEFQRLVLDTTPAMIYTYDRAGRLRSANRATAEALATRADDLVGRSLSDYLTPEAERGFGRRIERLEAEGELSGEVEIVRGDGTQRSVELHNRVVRGDADPLFLGTAIDVTNVRRAQRAVEESERRYRELFESSLALTCQHDLEGRLVLVNPATAVDLGYSEEELVGRNLADLVPPEHRPAVATYLARIRDEGEVAGFLHLMTKSGEERIVQFRNRRIADADGEPRVLGVALDVTDRRRMERLLAEQALQDPLTGLANRRLLDDRFGQALAGLARRRRRGEPARLALLLFDLDGFKAVNDRLGHARGDELLVAIARRVEGLFRRTDTVSRLGGDEFVVLLNEAGDDAQVESQARKTIAAVEACAHEIAPGVEVTAGAGVARYPEDGGDPATLLAAADRALYAAKAAGRGTVRFA